MKSYYALILLFILATSCAAQKIDTVPIIGGPCDGCENVFKGIPDKLESTARIAPKGTEGESLIVTGAVTNTDGTPAPGIILYAYQTDAGGIYPKSDTRHGSLRAWIKTDSEGKYRFETIRPGSYPNTNNPQHIHLHVIEPGKATYYIGDVIFDDDPLLTPEMIKQMDRGRGGSGLAHPKRDSDGVWHVTRDIVLRKGVSGSSQ